MVRLMETVDLIDFGFLTMEEQETIKHVLKRDMDLRKHEEKRIRKIKRQSPDRRCLKLQSGEWFEEVKAKRFVKYSSATDLLKCVLDRKQPGTLSSKIVSWLSKFTSSKSMQTAYPMPPNQYDLSERCHQVMEKNNVTDESTTVPDEQLSVTQILNDLEIILDLEIQNLNSTVDIADINGSSPENVLVDKTLSAVYSSHQVWHYPELMDMNAVQTNASPVTTIITASEEDLLENKFCFLPKGNEQYADHNYMPILHITDSLGSPGQLETPFCSSPNLPELFPSSNYFRYGSSLESNSNSFEVQSDNPNTDLELSCDLSLETESTLEPTIIEVYSPIMTDLMCKENVPIIDATL